MVHRVFAFLFALVLFGSGLTATQRVQAIERATLSSAEVLASVGAVDRLADPAESADLRLLDDRAAAGQQAETLVDVQAVLTGRAPEPASGLTMARPRPPTAPARIAPFLDGPQRPPCATAFIA